MTRQQVPNVELGTDTARLNLLTNGGFEIWQRGNGPFTTANGYAADRWQLFIGSGSTLSVQRTTVGSGPGGANSSALQATYTHAAESRVDQPIKVGTADSFFPGGRTLTFAADVFCTANNAARLRAGYDGTGGAAVYSAYVAGDSAWHRLSVTFTVPFDATLLAVSLDLMASGTFYIDNAMLVVGSVPADYAPLHPADDLARCLRYYETLPAVNEGGYLTVLQVYATTGANGALRYKVQKAVTPTVTVTNPSVFTCQPAVGGSAPCTAISTAPATVNSMAFTATVGSGLVAGNATMLSLSNGTGWIAIEANP